MTWIALGFVAGLITSHKLIWLCMIVACAVHLYLASNWRGETGTPLSPIAVLGVEAAIVAMLVLAGIGLGRLARRLYESFVGRP